MQFFFAVRKSKGGLKVPISAVFHLSFSSHRAVVRGSAGGYFIWGINKENRKKNRQSITKGKIKSDFRMNL